MPRPKKQPNRKQVAVYLTDAQIEALERLHAATRIPKTALVAEAVEDLFAKYATVLKQGRKS